MMHKGGHVSAPLNTSSTQSFDCSRHCVNYVEVIPLEVRYEVANSSSIRRINHALSITRNFNEVVLSCSTNRSNFYSNLFISLVVAFDIKLSGLMIPIRCFKQIHALLTRNSNSVLHTKETIRQSWFCPSS